MHVSSTDQHSLHTESSRKLEQFYRSTLKPQPIKMKFLVFFFLCCVAMAVASPLYTHVPLPGYIAPAFGSRTIVAGPTVVNGFDGLSRFVAPGYVGVY